MKSTKIQTTSVKTVINKQTLEYTYRKMSIEEIRKTKPKSRLESFLRRKALEERNQVL